MTRTYYLLFSLLFAASAFTGSRAADYHAITPPNSIVVAYPSTNVSRGSLLDFGFEGGGEQVAGSVYGYWFNTSASIVLPNGTVGGTWWTDNSQSDGSSTCTFSGPDHVTTLDTDPSKPPTTSIGFNTSTPGTGVYTLIWNVTYGTSTDPAVVNQTACNLAKLSYETWIYNASVTVIADDTHSGLVSPITKVLHTYQPTGLIMSNDASSTARRSWLLMLVGMGCAILRLI